MLQKKALMSSHLGNKPWIAIWALIGLFLCLPLLTIATPLASSDTSSQQNKSILKEAERKLLNMQVALEENQLSAKALSLIQQELDKTVEQIQTLQDSVTKKAEETEALIHALGPVPTANQPPEDSLIQAKRQALNTALSIDIGQQKQAELLLSQAKGLNALLAQRRLQTKAKGLLLHTLPLYSPLLWQEGLEPLSMAMKQVKIETNNIGEGLLHSLWFDQVAFNFIFHTLAVWIILGILTTLLYRRWQSALRHHPLPDFYQRLLQAIGYISITAILPLIGVWSCLFFLNAPFFLGPGHSLLLMLTSFWLAYSVVIALFSPHRPPYRLLPLPDKVCKRLAYLTFIFSALVVINTFFMTIRSHFPLPFTLLVEFSLRLITTAVGIYLFNKKTGLFSYFPPLEHLHYQTQQQFLRYLRQTAILVFITNPILILFGYSQLAQYLFMGFLLTALIILGATFIHTLMYEFLSHLLPKQDTPHSAVLSDKDKALLHYWILMGLDTLLICSGIILVLLVWGLNRTDLIRSISLLFTGFSFFGYRFSLTHLFLGILTFVSFFFITRFIQHILNKRIFPYTHLDWGLKNALHQGIGYVGLTLGFFVAIGTIGINLTSLALIAGALSVGIGLGLQNIVSNFMAGIIVLIERRIKPGDRIVIGQDEGIVRRINVRSTEIEGNDGCSIIVPNNDLMSSKVRNWGRKNPQIKLEIPLHLPYNSDTDYLCQQILELTKTHPKVAIEPTPVINFIEFGPQYREFKLTVLLDKAENRQTVNSDLHFAIDRLFNEANIYSNDFKMRCL